MSQCAACSEFLRPGQRTCPKCGAEAHLKRLTGTRAKPEADPQYGQCEWVSGERCHYAGVFASGGKYYCRAHDGCSDPVMGAQIVEQSLREVPSPDYSYNARRNASMDAVKREMEAWHTRLEAK